LPALANTLTGLSGQESFTHIEADEIIDVKLNSDDRSVDAKLARI
jgi:hypothetical protein